MIAGRKRATRRQILAVLDEITRGLEGLERPVLVAIEPVLMQAQREIERDLRSWLGRVDGAERFTTQRYRNALAVVRHANKTLRRLGGVTNDALWAGAEKAGQLATSNVVMEWQRFGALFEGTIQPVSIEVGAVIAKGDKLLIDRFASSAAKYAGSVRERVVNELAVSRVRGETMFELTNRLQKRFPEMWRANRSDADRLARTETMNAYNAYHQEGMKDIHKDDPEIVARWDASYDRRRCPMCASLDGQVRDVAKGKKFVAEWVTAGKGKVKRHQKKIDHPPAHPRCRCVMTPWHPSWEVAPHARAPKAEAASETLSL